MKWLIEKLRQSRDTRGAVNRKQGLLNYSIFNEQDSKPVQIVVDAQKLNQIIFNNKPKRVYKANRSAAVAFSDAKRVHTALREFNDLSANSVFQNITAQIEQMEQDNLLKKGFGTVNVGNKGHRGTMQVPVANSEMGSDLKKSGAGN